MKFGFGGALLLITISLCHSEGYRGWSVGGWKQANKQNEKHFCICKDGGVFFFFKRVGFKMYVMINTIWILLIGMNNTSALWKQCEGASLSLKKKSL